MQIDLSTIQDDIGGDWWLHHRAKDFGFLDKIRDQAHHEVNVDDVLIHKKILEGERFPTIRYHVVTASGTTPATNAETKAIMARSLVAFVNANNQLPFACTFIKTFKDGAAQVDYAPAQWEKFAIKVEPALVSGGDLATFFQHDVVTSNPAIPGSSPAVLASRPAGAKPAIKGSKVASEPAIEAIAASTGGSISIFDAEITAIEQRESKYQEEVTTFYLASLKGGMVAPDTKKSTEHTPFTTIRARFSDTIMDEIKLAPGDRITFNGKLKDDKYFGLLLQNVKKVARSGNSIPPPSSAMIQQPNRITTTIKPGMMIIKTLENAATGDIDQPRLLVEHQLIKEDVGFLNSEIELSFSPDMDYFAVVIDAGEDPENLEGEELHELTNISTTTIWDIHSFDIVTSFDHEYLYNSGEYSDFGIHFCKGSPTHLTDGITPSGTRKMVEALFKSYIRLDRQGIPRVFRAPIPKDGSTIPPLKEWGSKDRIPSSPPFKYPTLSSGCQYFLWWSEGKLHVYNRWAKQIVGTLTWKEPSKNLAISPDGSRVAIDGEWIWTIATGKCEKLEAVIEVESRYKQKPIISSQGDRVAIEMYFRGVMLWDCTSSNRLAWIQDIDEVFDWSPYGYFLCKRRNDELVALLADGGEPLPVAIPENYTNTLASKMNESKRIVDHAAISPDGSILATVDSNWNLAFWKMPSFGRSLEWRPISQLPEDQKAF